MMIKRDFFQWAGAKEDSRKHLPPGSLVYTGEYEHEPFEVRVLAYGADQVIDQRHQSVEAYLEAARDRAQPVCWINVTGLGNGQEMKRVFDHLGLAALTAEDILSASRHSKYEFNDGGAFHTLQMVYLKEGEVRHEKISLLLSDSAVVTFQETQGDVFDPLRKRIVERRGQIRTRGRDYLYYAILDAVVDHYLEVARMLRGRIESLEEKVMTAESTELRQTYTIRKQLLLLRSTALPLRPFVEELSGSPMGARFEPLRDYLSDLGDHLEHLAGELDMLKDLLDGLHETQMLIRSDRMNTVMTTLTIFSAVFIPLSFAAGIFGMNFLHMPGLGAPNAFAVFLVSCGVLAVGMVTLFRKLKWF